jgi:hypothetical protein
MAGEGVVWGGGGEELGCWELCGGGWCVLCDRRRRGRGRKRAIERGGRAAVVRLEVLGGSHRRTAAVAGLAGDGEPGDGGGIGLGIGTRRVLAAEAEPSVERGIVALAPGEELGLLVAALLLPGGVSWLGCLSCDSQRIGRVRPHRQGLGRPSGRRILERGGNRWPRSHRSSNSE